MSSPRKSYGPNEIREGTRFVLKEITASLHNSQTSPRKSGNESALQKSPEHAVKVQFAREFADVKKTTSPTTESLSSAGSFQSLSSTLSSKSSSGICADHLSESPVRSANTSYINNDIPGLDDLISACADIKITGIGDLSQDQTFSSACGDLSIIEEGNLPPEDFLPPIETFTSNVPFVSFNDSIAKTHGLQNINKDSLVFSTALDLQTLEEFVPKIAVDEKIRTECDLENESIEHVNSITECGFNLSIESQKNVSLIQNKNLLETSQLPGNITNVLNLTNPSDKSVENKSFQVETEEPVNAVESLKSPQKEIPTNSEDVNSEIFATPEEVPIPQTTRVTEEIPIISEQNIPVAEELSVSLEKSAILEEVPISQTPRVTEEILLNTSEKNAEELTAEKSAIIEQVPISQEAPRVAEEIPTTFEKNIQIVEESPAGSEIPEEVPISQETPRVAEEIPTTFEKNTQIVEESPAGSEILEEVPISQETPRVTEEILLNTSEKNTEELTAETSAIIEQVPISQETPRVAEEIPITFEQNFQTAEESPENSVIPEQIPLISEETVKLPEETIIEPPKEIPVISSEISVKSPEEIEPNFEESTKSEKSPEIITDNSNPNAFDSTFAITPDKNLEDTSQELKSPLPEFVDKIAVTPEKIHSSNEEDKTQIDSEKKNSPILQSILDKVAEQQKSLDDSYTVESTIANDLEQTPQEYQRNFHLSTIIESPPDFESPQKFLNNTVALSTGKLQKNSNSLEKSDIDSSSEIVFLKQSTLESTVVTVNGNHQESAKRKAPVHDQSFDDSIRLRNSLNLTENKEENCSQIEKDSQFELAQTETPKRPTKRSKIQETVKKIQEDIKKIEISKVNETFVPVELDSTIILESSEIDLEAPEPIIVVQQEEDYETFKPQKQSTDLTNIANFSLFEKVELEAQAVAQDIYNKSLEIVDDTDHFISATSELFQDPTSFDFLLNQGSSNTKSRDLRFESLYVKFDPLVNNSMLPQGNTQTENEEKNEKNEMPSVTSADTPMRNPAIAAIDRLLFYSPITTGNKMEATKDIKEATEPAPQEVPVVDEKMAKELELVRSLLVQHEEKLEKNEKEREEDKRKHQKDLKKQQDEYKKLEDKYRHLEIQIAEELESKKQVTVVLDEYEKSISRLVAERERDRTVLEEKERLKEELQTATQHLSNTEAAFNDVHQKYERVKNVVAAYKSNELVLKESHKENLETIAMLEKKYETLKSHAMAQLEKANHELETIRKQNDSENVKLQAMLKKTELKCKSLADQVEQKTKENKELTKILDEVIARVGNETQD
ncbi:transforming acidic coiled-coil-containing protein 3 isoform X2 [Leptopilina heterotoma]|uniref:transforming acidic coiled-coil-containing protein 3 isoform X2 n=1 Tax=Leptopilina heterotoma TaxID=63436 RepID=UPI001CA86C5D|nr:transforming acidic coiled-coil-containing protein 3 isoform X2 [Leptopilina heterotoma]